MINTVQSFREWVSEATEPLPTPRQVEPAMMTTSEYELFSDPDGKHHPSTRLWNYSVAELSKRNKPADFPELLFRKVIDGIRFEYKVKKEDRWVGDRYGDWDQEAKDYRRGPDGRVLMLNAAQAQKKFPNRRYDHSFGVFDEQGRCAGVTQDEWGALLVMVAKEYRGFGLGSELIRMHLQAEPEKKSGGFTSGGRESFRRAHADMVRDFSSKGFYSAMAKRGDITPSRGIEILKSVRPSGKSRPSRNLSSNNPEDWLLYAENGAWIVYDRKLRDLLQDDSVDEESMHMWAESMIKGLAHVSSGASGKGYYLWNLEGESPGLKRALMSWAVAWVAEDGSKLWIYNGQEEWVDPRFVKVDGHFASPAGKVASPAGMIAAERKFRKEFDKYDEFKSRLLELAFSKWN